MSGPLIGKPAMLGALAEGLRDFEVVEYRPLKMKGADGLWTSPGQAFTTGIESPACRTRPPFVTSGTSKATGSGSFEVFHDAARLRAFFEMVSRMSVEA